MFVFPLGGWQREGESSKQFSIEISAVIQHTDLWLRLLPIQASVSRTALKLLSAQIKYWKKWHILKYKLPQSHTRHTRNTSIEWQTNNEPFDAIHSLIQINLLFVLTCILGTYRMAVEVFYLFFLENSFLHWERKGVCVSSSGRGARRKLSQRSTQIPIDAGW